MYLRTVRAKGAEGVELEYIRLVEAYWENGRSKQRVIANLGRKDLLAPHLESLIELLGGGKKTKSSSLTSGERIEATLAACWGPMLVTRSLWREFGLESILDGLGPKTNRAQKAGRLPLADRVLVLVANRLCRPGSEHALAQWLESDFVCGRDGKRILARWKQQGRVRVELHWLQEWYRTLDQLLERKERIEVELFGRLRDLFHLQAEMVFYDLTSTYFEGHGPAGLADFGYSRDSKPRNRQVQVGLVMINGWPIAHHVFDGSLRDSETVESVLKDLQQRFGLRRVILVSDRGMVTIQNLALLRQRGQGYLVGLKRRRNEQVRGYIEAAAQGRWQECPVGICAREKEKPPRTMVTEVAGEEPGVRVFVVQSEERLAYERAMREGAMEKTRQALEKLALRVAAGRLQKAQNIGAAAARILSRNHGSRYYDWRLEQGVFRYFEHPVHLPAEKALEGKYVIQTEESDLSAVQAVEAYKELGEVERSFRQLKDLVEMRPIYHHRPERVRAHIFVAALAFLLACALEKKLKAAGVPMSSAQALEALRTMHVVDLRVGAEIRRGVTAGNHQARQILAALGISDRAPLQAQPSPKMPA
ncbi:MAG: IS1634 family transposase [Acidobacteriaceae bacterium]|nr:IS1634 family transposase [Acidobacteriaceae bacterium]